MMTYKPGDKVVVHDKDERIRFVGKLLRQDKDGWFVVPIDGTKFPHPLYREDGQTYCYYEEILGPYQPVILDESLFTL